MNVKNPLKGRNLNDSFCEPIRSVNDEKLHWLSQFYEWLCAWEQLQLQPRHGCLSKETFFALKQTVIAAKLLAEYLLNSVRCHYVLLGKFQTDDLEFRFGQYRQMSGANYNVSVAEIMESEKKLRILSVMKLVSHSHGSLQCEILLRVVMSLVSQTQIQRSTAALIWLHFKLSSLTVTLCAFLTVRCQLWFILLAMSALS